jgi:hypothetical protein
MVTLSIDQWNALMTIVERAPMTPAEHLWIIAVAAEVRKTSTATNDTKES